jgi:hypothetical protein
MSIVTVDRLRGAAKLEALEAEGRLWATPAETADVLERDVKSVYAGLDRGDIPSVRVGPRYQISVAWLRRAAEGRS